MAQRAQGAAEEERPSRLRPPFRPPSPSRRDGEGLRGWQREDWDGRRKGQEEAEGERVSLLPARARPQVRAQRCGQRWRRRQQIPLRLRRRRCRLRLLCQPASRRRHSWCIGTSRAIETCTLQEAQMWAPVCMDFCPMGKQFLPYPNDGTMRTKPVPQARKNSV